MNRIILLSITLVVSTSIAQAKEAAVSNFQLEDTQFELADGTSVNAKIGTLLVPENRQATNSRFIPINFAWLKTNSANPGTPIVYLAGGPGGSGIQAAQQQFAFFGKLLELSDVIVFDQRGTGENDMTCPKRVYLPIEKSLLYDEVLTIFINETLPCKTYFHNLGFDLNGYTTLQSAHDVNDLRNALGIDKITLIGSSYGSHYALAVLKYYEETIDKLVLSGIEGPNDTMSLPSDFDKHLEDVDTLMRDQIVNQEKLPNLVTSLSALLTELDKAPRVITTSIPNTELVEDVEIGKFEVQLLLYSLLGRDRSIGLVPKLIIDMQEGRYEETAELVYKLKSSGQSISAMLIVMDGASGASQDRLSLLREQDRLATLGPVVHFLFPDIANAWGVPDLDSDFRAPINSIRPALLVSGSMDARTPISNSDRIAEGLPNSVQITIQNAGHPPSLLSIVDLVSKFLMGERIASQTIAGPTITFEKIQ